MWILLKRLALGIVLIFMAAAALLISDLRQRKTTAGRLSRVAIFQLASASAHEESVRGIDDAIRKGGFVDGQNVMIQHFNALGDMPTANAIAKQITDGSYDLVVTVTTPLLQVVANNNKSGKTPHVFGLVADPFVAGIGLNRDRPADHPAHLTGIGTFLPVQDSLKLARDFFPALNSIGVVWNPSEANSAAYLKLARVAAAASGLRLLEAAVDNSAAVLEAAQSLVARGVEAFWVGGDSTVNIAIDSIIKLAHQAHIPVVTIVPGEPSRGTLFDYGADFYQVGFRTGELAVQVLRGKPPKAIAIENYAPKFLVVNELALTELKKGWRLPPEIRAASNVFVDSTGVHRKPPAEEIKTAKAELQPLAKHWKVFLIEYVKTPETEEGEKGVLDGLRTAGLVEGRDYSVKILNAQGDMATVSSMVDAAMTEGADLIITLTTPALQAALRRAGSLPVVFAVVSDGIAAGAGRSAVDHRPTVTGVQFKGAHRELLTLVRQVIPRVRVIGTLFVPAEVNMVREKERLMEAAQDIGFEVVAAALTSSTEMPDAALALTSRRLDAVVQLPGNLTSAGFASVVNAARKSKLPIFGFQTSQARAGAVLALARDYFDSAREAGLLAARVMRGEDPAKIPFQTYEKNKLVVNVKAARDFGIELPSALLQKSQEVVGQ